MRQRIVLALIGTVALTMAGCAAEEETPTASSPSPEATASPASTAQKPFAKPLVAQKPTVPTAIPGLIQSTNPDERARQVQANLQAKATTRDPFAGLPPTLPKAKPATVPTKVPTVSKLPQGRTQPLSPSTPPPPSSLPPQPGLPGSPTAIGSPGPSIAALPEQPKATLANEVEVSGVIQVGGVTQAIVRAPNEPTSRYVRVGQRLSDGQILVKRIEMNAAGSPVVVLEENGIEVSRSVGERAKAVETKTT